MTAPVVAVSRRFVWLLRKPSGHTFRPRRNTTARQVKHFAERMEGCSWRELYLAGYRVERVPVRQRRPRPELVP